MTNYNDEYYFIDSEALNDMPSLTPNDDTAFRLRRSRANPEGDAPYIFHNGAIDYQKGTGVTPLAKLPNIMIGTNELYFDDLKFEEFMKLNLPNMVCHPCIYIDHKEDWHENMWHVYVLNKIDCWDRKRSEYDEDTAEETKDGIEYDVNRYSLDSLVLDNISLKDRLIFRMGGVTYGGVLVHKSLKNFLTAYGVRFIPIADFFG